jgi:hypothetical protein
MIVVAFILGFLTCRAFCWKRLRESARAAKAARERLAIADEKIGVATKKIEAQEQTLSQIRGLARRMKSQRDSEFGEDGALPASAENPTGQRFVFHTLASGPSRARRSRFFRRRQ